jgi:Icc-related predicted phosphoesterase
MRIVTISDTHSQHSYLTSDLAKLSHFEDENEKTILIHSGDCTNFGDVNEIKSFLDWFSNLAFKYKVFIAGNHDFCFLPATEKSKKYPDIPQMYKDKGVIYLRDKMVEIEGIKIYGSPWQPEFFNWAFNLPRGEIIARKWRKIPKNTDILVTHGPPYGILDTTYTGIRVGCEELYKRVVKVVPKIHIFGHIHDSYGYKEFNGTSFINASCLGEYNICQNKPIILELDDEKNIINIQV